MDLSKIKAVVKNKKSKRRGKGPGSGSGKTSGRGHKGVGQRKGKKLPYIGFSGGNLPFLRMIPKRGFKPPKQKVYQIVNLADIKKKPAPGRQLNPETMEKLKLVKDKNKPIKILAGINEKIDFKLNIKADRFSRKAKEIIEANGGNAECLKR